jgi:hypothetical protein
LKITKEPLDIQVWRGRSHNTNGSTTSWRSRIQFPLQRFSFFNQQLAITSTSISSSTKSFLNLIQPSTMNEIELLASYSPIHNQLWSSIARSNGCILLVPIEEDNNKVNNNNDDDNNNNEINNDNSNNNLKKDKGTTLVKVIYRDNNIDFTRRYHFKIITIENSHSINNSYLSLYTGPVLMYNKCSTIINNITDNYQWDQWSIYSFVVREYISYIIQFYNNFDDQCFYCPQQNIDFFLLIPITSVDDIFNEQNNSSSSSSSSFSYPITSTNSSSSSSLLIPTHKIKLPIDWSIPSSFLFKHSLPNESPLSSNKTNSQMTLPVELENNSLFRQSLVNVIILPI